MVVSELTRVAALGISEVIVLVTMEPLETLCLQDIFSVVMTVVCPAELTPVTHPHGRVSLMVVAFPLSVTTSETTLLPGGIAAATTDEVFTWEAGRVWTTGAT